jgi:glycogen operon protein
MNGVGHKTATTTAYCQDNEISWFNWERDEKQNQFFEFTRKLTQLRKEHPVFRRSKFLKGRRIPVPRFEM